MTTLVSKVDSLATRVAEEFNAVRAEIDSIEVFSNIDGGNPSSVFSISQARFDGGGP